jgi:fluoroacetyl-CoA thioesterase
MAEPDIDATASAELVVRAPDLASIFRLGPEDAFPPVFATARMVALMELAAARILVPYLGPGELSVGTTVDVVHSAATPEGATVTATARYLGRERNVHLFEVVARDAGGEIGRATHRRAVVANERLVAGARRRNAPEIAADGSAPPSVPDAPVSVPPVVEGATHPRGLGLERSLIRARQSAVTVAAWTLTIGADEGEGEITLVDLPGEGAIYRGDGICLGWPQERLAAAYATLSPRDTAGAFEMQQFG